MFEPQSSVSASGSSREVQATGGCGDYWTGCSRRIHWNASGFEVFDNRHLYFRAFCGLQLADQSSFVIMKTLVTQLA